LDILALVLLGLLVELITAADLVLVLLTVVPLLMELFASLVMHLGMPLEMLLVIHLGMLLLMPSVMFLH
jgi:hypothetical protein